MSGVGNATLLRIIALIGHSHPRLLGLKFLGREHCNLYKSHIKIEKLSPKASFKAKLKKKYLKCK